MLTAHRHVPSYTLYCCLLGLLYVGCRCQMDQELLSFALKSPPTVMLEAADHLLAAGNTQAAALLYEKGGKLGKAVEMAFAAGMTDVLDSITSQLDQDAEPELLNRCVDAIKALHAGVFVVFLKVFMCPPPAVAQRRALYTLAAHLHCAAPGVLMRCCQLGGMKQPCGC